MKKIYLIIIIVIIAVFAIAFFIPKKVGGPLCGPVCPILGLHYWEKDCIGFKIRDNYIDGYDDKCYGFSSGFKRCYGVPYIMPEGTGDINLPCDYPCNDMRTKEYCTGEDKIIYFSYEISCDWLFSRCKQ